MKKLVRAAIWSVVLVGGLMLAADRSPQAADALPHARLMPRGALAHLQVRNFAELFKTWRGSQTRERYFASPSWKAFTNSRLYVKLQERIGEFEQGLGFGFTEDNVANVAGGLSSVAMYDLGKLEAVYITEMPTAQATANVLYKQSARFEARKHRGLDYYVQEMSNDGGRLQQGFSFAAASGKFIVATTEPLMRRTLDNLGESAANDGDRLWSSMAPTLDAAEGFAPHDLTLWTDVPRLRENRFFKLYWIHGRADSLDGVAATLADVEFSAAGISERRWSLLTEEAQKAAMKPPVAAKTTTELLRFASADTQGVQIGAASSDADRAELVQKIAQTILPPVAVTPPTSNITSPPSADMETEEDSSRPAQRYRTLDERFDKDVDDPAARRPVAAAKIDDAEFTKTLGELLQRAKPSAYADLGGAEVGPEGTFVRVRRAFVLELKGDFDAARFEALVADHLRKRLLPAGAGRSPEWKADASGVRAPSTGFVEQGGAYLRMENYLIVGNHPAYCAALAASFKAKTAPSFAPELQNTVRFAWVRLGAASGPYRKLMQKLEYVPSNAPTPMDAEGGEGETVEEAGGPTPFLGANLGSLLAATDYVSDVTAESARDGQRIRERVVYRYGRPGA